MIGSCGHFIHFFGKEGKNTPSSLHIVDKYVYVSDFYGHQVILSPRFITQYGSTAL